MRITTAALAALLCATTIARAEVPTPPRPVTDPKSVTSPENQLDALQRTIDWFDKYLKPAK